VVKFHLLGIRPDTSLYEETDFGSDGVCPPCGTYPESFPCENVDRVGTLTAAVRGGTSIAAGVSGTYGSETETCDEATESGGGAGNGCVSDGDWGFDDCDHDHVEAHHPDERQPWRGWSGDEKSEEACRDRDKRQTED
jgi:hypothetical protein